MKIQSLIPVAAVLLAACGDGEQRPPDTDVDRGAEITMRGDALTDKAVIQLARKGAIGQYLADREGRSLYVLEEDTPGSGGSKPVSACTGPCVEQWQPVTSEKPPEAMAGIDGGMLSRFRRDDGTMQVTYNGHPLYHYHIDQRPGYTEGQAKHDTWGHWYLLSPDSQMIEIDTD